MANRTGRRAVALGTGLCAVVALATACSQAPARPATHHPAAPPAAPPTVPPVPPHGGVNLNVLVVTDGTPPVESIRQELAAEQIPTTVVNLHALRRPVITRAFLARANPDGTKGGNFDGVVLPGSSPAGLTATENAALIWYEQRFHVREVDAYSPPMPDMGMISPPVYSGTLTGTMGVTEAGAQAGFGYLKTSFPFSGGPAGAAPFGYLAQPEPGGGATPLITSAIPHSSASATLVWQYDHAGRQQLGIGFGYGYYQPQFHYLGNGIVSWVTRGVNLGDWRNYLDIAYDDMFLGNAQWSIKYHCTPQIPGACPKGTPITPGIRMVPADVTYLVQWEKQHHFTIEWLFNGGASARFAVHGVDALLVATRPVAKDFYWVNHTWTHAWMGCQQDFSVTPWRCVTSGGQYVWAAGTSFVNTQFLQNFAWAGQNGITVERDAVAPGEYTGLAILPQQRVDNPYMDAAMGPDHIKWVAMDASRDPTMRPVGAAFGVPRHPVDVGEDVDTAAEEVSEFNWYNDSKADGGGGFCQGSKVTRCLKPLSLKTGWTSFILPGQVQIVFQAMLSNDARPFFLHQSNLTGDKLGYPFMDDILSAYRAVYGLSAPIANLPMDQDGPILRDQQLWAQEAHTVTAWVQGHTLTISGPRGATVPVTVPDGSTIGSAAGPAFGSPYAGERSEYTQLGSQPLQIDLGSAPY